MWKRSFGKRRRIRFWKASQHFFLRRVNAGRVQHPSLCRLLHLDCKPNVLSLRLSIGSVRLLRDHDIHYKASRNHGGRKISLWKEMDSVSMCDDRDGLLVGSSGG